MREDSLICMKCKVPLAKIKTTFSYLKHEFYTEIPRCPKCGQVFISEDLAKGKMSSVETQLEDK